MKRNPSALKAAFEYKELRELYAIIRDYFIAQYLGNISNKKLAEKAFKSFKDLSKLSTENVYQIGEIIERDLPNGSILWLRYISKEHLTDYNIFHPLTRGGVIDYPKNSFDKDKNVYEIFITRPESEPKDIEDIILDLDQLEKEISHEITHLFQKITKLGTGSKTLPNDPKTYERDYPNVQIEHKAYLESYYPDLTKLIREILSLEINDIDEYNFQNIINYFHEDMDDKGFNSKMKRVLFKDFFRILDKINSNLSKEEKTKLKRAGFPV